MAEIMAVVIDNGSTNTRAGIAEEEAPRYVFESIIGRPKKNNTTATHYVGDAAVARRGMLNIDYAVERGIINNWDNIELLWQHIYDNELNLNSEEYPILLTEPTLNPKLNRTKTIELMFERFKVPSFYLADQAVLALFTSSSSASGLVFQSGGGLTQAVPIYQGHALHHAVMQLDLAGQDLTEYLCKSMIDDNIIEPSYSCIVSDLKEKCCQVAMDYDHEWPMYHNDPNHGRGYELPDGSMIRAMGNLIKCPEVLFQPSLLGLEKPGIHELIIGAIKKMHPDVQNDIYNNIILAGGNTMFPGLPERLTKELTPLVPQNARLKVIAPPERKHSTWIGGSIKACMTSFQSSWIGRDEYDEVGSNIVNLRCF